MGSGAGETTMLGAGLWDGGEPHTIIRGLGELLYKQKNIIIKKNINILHNSLINKISI